ncbi:DoxX family protein [Mucilaginibacter sp. AW1-7]|uniref:DoxX family protein n=1 Tax=Mucilaginibacter sp. AW1-7 TaxID=3349874 RepID=UPI003F73D6CF
METTVSSTPAAAPSKSSLLAGRIISIICILFLLFDAIAKILKESHSVQGTVTLGYSENMVTVIGTILLISTIIYIIPRTAILGAILITGYLGGAVAIMMRANQPAYFPIVFGILVWLSLYLRDGKVKSLLNFGGKW